MCVCDVCAKKPGVLYALFRCAVQSRSCSKRVHFQHAESAVGVHMGEGGVPRHRAFCRKNFSLAI